MIKNRYETRSYLKIRIFGRDQGEAETQPAGILWYVEDLRRGLNADIGRKDFFEMAYRSRMIGYYPLSAIRWKINDYFCIFVFNCLKTCCLGLRHVALFVN
jgi:hypothetical protein